jgi:SOS response regulatory protein OraA/RecX
VEGAIAEQWPAGADRRALPAALAAKRAAQLGNLPRPAKRRRLLAFLARRGFTGNEALEAVAGALR